MVIGASAIIRSLMIYGQSIGSAEPDPERVRRFIETAPPLPKHLIRVDHESAGSDPQGPSTTRADPEAYGHDPEGESR
ncbi:hypothetical protein [Alloyangia pacifica]|uniref:Uncharacterized protein n=1 Tax=Alloyangia pacifica TaxID=311180 RepID=A0A1I6WLW9_9RHOB|nr:hypothetical protein [Alloyangia pacifica]SDI92462.1 hypothetical protein SAMN04488245_13116 [Alloyangia pacifica]SFT27012.1 hypothetical protein SAMN04488050_12716 [Alloyangia pacifica]